MIKVLKSADFSASTPDGATLCAVHYADGTVERSVTSASQPINVAGLWSPGAEPLRVEFSNDSEVVYTMPIECEHLEFEEEEPEAPQDPERTEAQALGDLLENYLKEK